MITRMTALQIGGMIKEKKLGCVEAVQESLKAIELSQPVLNAYISVDSQGAIEQAKKIQKKIDSGETLSPLAGVPMSLKDNISTKGMLTTCGSKMLSNYAPAFNATIVDRLADAGAVVLGKNNMDEFAMGGSSETSYFGLTKNPWDISCVPGGSSGGSAAAVASGQAAYAIGSDTGGSIRQPCAFCNLTGIKPTYGSVSRYGLVAFASSLDQIGPMARNIEDCAAVLSVISGKDDRDNTSVIEKPFDFSNSFTKDIQGLKIGLLKNYLTGESSEGLEPDVEEAYREAVREFEHLGAVVGLFDMPVTDYVVAAYYIIACAEASSNLSRYDGVKYGYISPDAKTLAETYIRSRSEGFGMEVKRRILLGSFVLSSGYYDAYYKKALQARAIIKASFEEAFREYDILLCPTTPTAAYKIGANIKNTLKMYLGDIYTASVNIAGLPAVALPCGFNKNGLPIGMQLIGRAFSEPLLVKTAYAYQSVTNHHTKTPVDRRDQHGNQL